MQKNIFIVLGIFLLIFGLALITNWRFQKTIGGFSQDHFSLPKLEKIEITLPQINPATVSDSYQEFISPDNKFKIKYPPGWFVVEERDILERVISEELKKKFNLKILFLAQGLQKDQLGQIILFKGDFEMPIREIAEEMWKNNREQGWQAKIIQDDFQKNEGSFEAEYLLPTGQLLHSKEKIWIDDEGEVYLLSFVAPEKDWQKLEKEADLLISSAQLLTK